MAYLFASSPASYAEEKLSNHLGSLSTLPVHLPQSSTQSYTSQPSRANPVLEAALHELSASRPLTLQKVADVLRSLAKPRGGVLSGYVVESEVDRLVEAEVMARAVTMVWKEVMQVLLEGALALEEEKSWWDASLSTRRGVGIYLVQTLPHRIFRALPPASSLRTFHFPPAQSLFRQPSAVLATAITSPYTLTRREMLSSRKSLTTARNNAAKRIGLLASQGPRWSAESGESAVQSSSPSDLQGETSRIYGVVCEVLEVPPPASPSSKRSRSTNTIPPSPALTSASPSALLTVLTTHHPRARQNIDKILSTQSRPSALTRLWFPLLFLPPVLWTGSSTILRNKEWMKAQIRNARETIRGFVVQWVWEPLEGIGKTLRGGGEGLGVAPTTVKSDQASLERMVLDLGRDYYHLSGSALDALGDKVRNGDMEEVLRVYEKEMQNPVRNALMGSLVRTLLIQVQKTKTDLSLSLLSLDHLLRSQQLTFAFVGVAPSVLVLYGLGGWVRGLWRGEKRGKGRKRQYFNGLRDIERLLLTSPKHGEELSDRDRGLLIISVSGMRSWAAGLSGSSRGPFLDDLRMLEDPSLSRGDKLRVVERIWRCWGTHGQQKT